ncbi:hypothetical protein P3S68_000111 [Capsicum galapagoense]
MLNKLDNVHRALLACSQLATKNIGLSGVNSSCKDEEDSDLSKPVKYSPASTDLVTEIDESIKGFSAKHEGQVFDDLSQRIEHIFPKLSVMDDNFRNMENSNTYVGQVFANFYYGPEYSLVEHEVFESLWERSPLLIFVSILMPDHISIHLPFDPGEPISPPILFECGLRQFGIRRRYAGIPLNLETKVANIWRIDYVASVFDQIAYPTAVVQYFNGATLLDSSIVHLNQLGSGMFQEMLELFLVGLELPFDPCSNLLTIFLRVIRNSVYCVALGDLDHDKLIMSTLWNSCNWIDTGQERNLPGILLSKSRELGSEEKIKVVFKAFVA